MFEFVCKNCDEDTVEVWQKAVGIDPAKGDKAEALRVLSRNAYDLIRVIELERSGIRDGTGFWHGSNALWGAWSDINDAWDAYNNVWGGFGKLGDVRRGLSGDTDFDVDSDFRL